MNKENTFQKLIKRKIVWLLPLIILFIFPFIGIVFNEWFGINWGNLITITSQSKIFFTIWTTTFGVIGLIINIIINSNRLSNQEKQLGLQSKNERNGRFSKAIELLGNTHESARIGAAHSLYFLAKEYKEEYREVVLNILCSHIRTTTMLNQYQEEYAEAPSNEIKTIIEILFKKDYILNSFSDGYEADLSGSFLQGLNTYDASLNHVNLDNVNFNNAVISKIDFIEAKIRNTSFKNAKITDCNFQSATISNTRFIKSVLDRALFYDCYIDNTTFEDSNLYSPHFEGSNIINSLFCISEIYNGFFEGTHISTASSFICSEISKSQFQGSYLKHLLFWGSSIEESSFDCAHLERVNFEGCAVIKTSMLGGGCFELESKNINDFYKYDRTLLLKKQKGMETLLSESVLFGLLKANHKEIINRRLKQHNIQSEIIKMTNQQLSINIIESQQTNFEQGIPNEDEVDRIINKLKGVEKTCNGWRLERNSH
jgi:uncharacterized protein YjbI with pentapeptide repeats